MKQLILVLLLTALGTLQTLVARGQADGIFHHLLNLAAIFGHQQLLALSVVV